MRKSIRMLLRRIALPGSYFTEPDRSSGSAITWGELFLPVNYQSGTTLNTTATWTNMNYAILGLTPGTYNWTY